jgi:mono/diheme cytochrome c family protein
MQRLIGVIGAAAWVFGGPVACGDKGGDSADDPYAALELEGDEAAGSTVFSNTCGSSLCHGPDGAGTDTDAEDLREKVPSYDDKQIVDIVTNGYEAMPPQYLEDQEIADVLAYLRATFP